MTNEPDNLEVLKNNLIREYRIYSAIYIIVGGSLTIFASGIFAGIGCFMLISGFLALGLTFLVASRG